MNVIEDISDIWIAYFLGMFKEHRQISWQEVFSSDMEALVVRFDKQQERSNMSCTRSRLIISKIVAMMLKLGSGH